MSVGRAVMTEERERMLENARVEILYKSENSILISIFSLPYLNKEKWNYSCGFSILCQFSNSCFLFKFPLFYNIGKNSDTQTYNGIGISRNAETEFETKIERMLRFENIELHKFLLLTGQ